MVSYGIHIKKAEPPISQIFEDHGYGIHRKNMKHGMTFGENSLYKIIKIRITSSKIHQN